MAKYHSLLLRQLKRLGVEPTGRGSSAGQWANLLDRVSRAYTEADQDRYLLERSQETSSREMQELYGRLEEAQRIARLGNWEFDWTGGGARWSDECFRLLGLDPSAPVPMYRDFLRRVHKTDRPWLRRTVRQAVQDCSNFEAEFRLTLPDREVRWVRAIGHPVTGAQGRAVRLHGTLMDITRRKIVEVRQSMEHAVTRLLAGASTPAEVMPKVIQTICEALGWACGALWTQDKKAGVLRRVAVWTLPQPRLAAFFQTSRDAAKVAGCKGLIGRTLSRGTPSWIPDVALDADFPRRAVAQAAGLRAAFAFPIQAGNEVLGVIEFFAHQTKDEDPEVLRSAHFIGRQIGQFTQRQQAEDALRESEAHFRALVEQASDSFYVHDSHGRFIDVNQRGCDSLGYSRAELLTMTIADIDVERPAGEASAPATPLATNGATALESRYRRKDGSTFPVEIRIGPIEIDGHQHLLSLVRDVTERKQLQDHIQHLAYHDALTNLPNRAMFNGYLSHAIVQAQRYRKGLALLFIDLDRFKNINDTLGHDAGDKLLQEMARRLTACLREGDLVARLGGDDDVVARLGGDEFVVLIEEMTDSAYASHVARKILAASVKEYALNGQLIHMTASIGISTFPEDGNDERTLMQNADIAMYRAKEKGKNNYQFYSAQMNLHSFELLALESGLRRALTRDELVLHYQPKVNVRTGRIVGVEALVRWRHPELGLVYPEHFIPLAEETGLIIPLSKWVLRQACEQNRLWQEQGLPTLRMAVNLSARQLADENLLADIAATVAQAGLNPALLELEVTESVVMYNADKAVQLLTGLKAMGIRIAVDDFGIGYSSLSHLKRLPIDVIKIDRSFIHDVPGGAADEAISQAIIAMAKSLNIIVVAEGVETAAQWQFLRAHGCDEFQGYYFSEPLAAAEFAELVEKNLDRPIGAQRAARDAAH